MLKPDPTNSRSYVERIDSDVVSAFAGFLVKIIEINPEVVVTSRYLPEIMNQYMQICTHVSEV